MDTSLKDRISVLAREFADAVVAVISGELADRLDAGRHSRSPGGPRRSRSAGSTWASEGDAHRAAARIVAVLQRHPDGVRAENLRAAVGFSRAQMGRPLALLLQGGQVRKVGQRRRTTYHLAAGKAAGSARPAASPARTATPAAREARKSTAGKPNAAQRPATKAAATRPVKVAVAKRAARSQ